MLDIAAGFVTLHYPMSSLKLSVLIAAFLPLMAAADTIINSPFGGSSDGIDRGFYVLSYGASSLGTVQLAYDSNVAGAGSYQVTLTARQGTYNGPLINAITMTFSVIGGFGLANETVVTYDFAGVSVVPGGTITFAQTQVSGPGTLLYDVGMAPYPAGLVETDGTTSPLDTPRFGRGVGVIITDGSAVPDTGASVELLGLGLAGCVFGASSFRRRANV
jgi:hypothetical protein